VLRSVQFLLQERQMKVRQPVVRVASARCAGVKLFQPCDEERRLDVSTQWPTHMRIVC
jgi:hypothetical protein